MLEWHYSRNHFLLLVTFLSLFLLDLALVKLDLVNDDDDKEYQ